MLGIYNMGIKATFRAIAVKRLLTLIYRIEISLDM